MTAPTDQMWMAIVLFIIALLIIGVAAYTAGFYIGFFLGTSEQKRTGKGRSCKLCDAQQNETAQRAFDEIAALEKTKCVTTNDNFQSANLLK